LRVKGVFLKVGSGSVLTVSGTTLDLNSSNSGAVKVTQTGNIVVEGNVSILSSASVMVDGTLSINGNWTNDATGSVALAGGSMGTISFTGTNSQQIGGTTQTQFENIEIDNAAGITLANSLTIENQLTFTNGIITTGANRVDVTATADGMVGPGIGNYIIGTIRRYVSAGIEYSLPIGTVAGYELAGIYVNNQTGLNYIDATFNQGNQNPVPGGLTVNGVIVSQFLDYGYWTFVPNGGTSAINYNVTIRSTLHTDNGGNADNYSLITNTGSGWQNLGVHSTTTQTYSATVVLAKRQGLTAAGDYIIGYSPTSLYNPIPVTSELNVKGTILKVPASATATLTGNSMVLNNSDNGAIEVALNGNFVAEGNVNLLSAANLSVSGAFLCNSNVNLLTGASLIVTGTFESEGNINLQSGSAIMLDGTLSVKGDWTNDATASIALAGVTNGIVQFTGTSSQQIGGTTQTQFENLEIDNTAGITLANSVTIQNQLTFSNGIITTGAFFVENAATANEVLGYGNGKYVFGNFRRYVSTGIEFLFPIGSATEYELAGIYVNSQTGLTYIESKFTQVNQNPVPGGLTVNGVAVNEFLDYGYWTFVPNAGTSALNYNVTIRSTQHTDKGGTADNYSLITDVGGGWQNIGVHSIATQEYSPTVVLAKRQGLTAAGNYIIGYSAGSLYSPQPITSELRIKGSILKVPASATATITGTGMELNNSDNGTVKVALNGNFVTEGNVNLLSSATLSVVGTFVSEKNVNILSSSAIMVDGTLSVKGDWTNDATASVALAGATKGTISFTGTSSQQIGGITQTLFENLEIDNTAGVTLANSFTIQDQLTFTNGIITTGAFLVENAATANEVIGHGNGKYVFGNYRRYVSPGIEYLFPIGSATGYEMAGIYVNSQTGLTYIDSKFTQGDQNPVPGGLSVNGIAVTEFLNHGYWTFVPNIGTSAINYNVNISSTQHTDKGGTADNYSLITDIGSGWQNLGVHSIATQEYSPTTVLAKRQGLTSAGNFVIGYSALSLYNPEPVTSELRIKGLKFKIPASATATLYGAAMTLNNSDNGTIMVAQTGNLIDEGNVNILPGASIMVDGTVSLKGNWTNDGTASVALVGSTKGTIGFSGTTLQQIGGSVQTLFENFEINNTAGITLTNSITVQDQLTFTNGIINTGANRVDVTASNDGMVGHGDGKYIFGTMRRYVAPGIEYTLPIGTATGYELAGIYVNILSGLTYIDATFTNSNQNPVPGGLSVNGVVVDEFLDYGYWSFTPDAGTLNYNVTVQSTLHTDKGGNADNYSLITDIGSDWQNLGVHSISTQQYSSTAVLAKRQGLTSAGNFIIGYSASSLYTPQPITSELRVKGLILKVPGSSNATLTGSGMALNNSDNGIIKVAETGNLIADGNVNILPSASIMVDGTVSLKGNWINDGTASIALVGATNGTIGFTGTTSQLIGGSVQTLFENLEINNPAGISLTNSLTIQNQLTFTNGIITTGANRVDVTATSDGMVGHGDGKYVFGTIRRYVSSGIEYSLPIGNASGYELAGIYLNSYSGLTYIDATFTNSNQNPVPGGLLVNSVTVDEFLDYGYWTFTPDAGTLNYNVTVRSTLHTDKGGTADNYSLITNIGSGYQNLGVHSISTQQYSPTAVLAKRQGLTSAGNYVIGYSTSSLYNQQPSTSELQVKGSYFKIPNGNTTTLTGSGITLNNSNNGSVKVALGGNLVLDGDINVLTGTTLTILGSFTGSGDINIFSGASILIDGTLSVKGNWTNDGTASVALPGITKGTVGFTGTLLQQIGGSVPTIFENLTVNNVAGLTLANSMTVQNQLSLTNGIITTGANKVICLSTANTDIQGYSASSFVNGTLEKSITTNTNIYPLPIGKGTNSTDYHLAEFLNNNVTGVTTLTASVSSITETPPNDDASLDPLKAIQWSKLLIDVKETAQWSIIPTGALATGDYGVNLYVGNIIGLSDADDNEFVVMKRPTGSVTYADWNTFESTTTIPANSANGRIFDSGAGYAQRTGYTTFSEYVVATTESGFPLPIELLYFNAYMNNNIVDINWATETETGNDYFIIEKTNNPNSNNWQEIEEINGAGYSHNLITYQTKDLHPYSGTSYYRLKQVDFNGDYSLSNIESVINRMNSIYEIEFYPNPYHKGDNLAFSIKGIDEKENITLEIIDMNGMVIKQIQYNTEIDENNSLLMEHLNNLTTGCYLLQSKSNSHIMRKTIIITE